MNLPQLNLGIDKVRRVLKPFFSNYSGGRFYGAEVTVQISEYGNPGLDVSSAAQPLPAQGIDEAQFSVKTYEADAVKHAFDEVYGSLRSVQKDFITIKQETADAVLATLRNEPPPSLADVNRKLAAIDARLSNVEGEQIRLILRLEEISTAIRAPGSL